MRLLHHQQEQDEERYDVEIVSKVAALAARLQERDEETLTPGEIEEAASEVGLRPEYVRKALATLTAPTPSLWDRLGLTRFFGLRHERLSRAVAFGGPLVWAALVFVLAMLMQVRADGLGPALAAILLLSPWPVAALAGYISGNRRLGTAAGLVTMLSLIPSLLFSGGGIAMAELCVLFWAVPFTSLVGYWGGRLSESRQDPLLTQTTSREELVKQMMALQQQLEGQRQHHAFLSLDVVASTQMKQNAPELDVEFSFGSLRSWTEQVILAYGGQVHSAAGDGMMAMFHDDLSAVRAGRWLQEGIKQFNDSQNRLPLSFRVRCGISAGELAIDAQASLGNVYSPIIDRAAALQKAAEPGELLIGAELQDAATIEFGALSTRTDVPGQSVTLRWRPETPETNPEAN